VCCTNDLLKTVKSCDDDLKRALGTKKKKEENKINKQKMKKISPLLLFFSFLFFQML